jgi:hypothetical protein
MQVLFGTVLTIGETLAQLDDGNTAWQRDLSVSQNKIGDVLRAQGDLAGALLSCRPGLAIAERLTARDGGNSRWQQDVFLSLIRLTEVRLQDGQRGEACDFARRLLLHAELLTEWFPQDLQREDYVRDARALVGEACRGRWEGFVRAGAWTAALGSR